LFSTNERIKRGSQYFPSQLALLYVVVGLACPYDPESCAGGSVAAGRISHAGQVKGDDPDKKGYPSPLGLGLGVGLTAPSRKKF
jgi:hypothetical protein